jgi:hypothetical protein
MVRIMNRYERLCRLGRVLAPLLALLLAAGLTGCAAARQAVNLEPRKPNAELLRYQEGLQFYANGEYAKALEQFEPLAYMAADESLRSRAFYSLACTRIVTAKNIEEFDEALDLWYAWSNSQGWSDAFPDPKLMSPLLTFLRPPFTQDCDEDDELVERPEPPAEPVKPKPERVNPLKVRPEKKDTECQKTLLDTQRKMRKLQEQLNALEAISVEMREKRREMAAPK